MEPKEVTVYTDGGAQGNPGPGGFGVVLLHGPHRKEISGGFRLTTNNRMELFAAITALEALKMRCRVRLFSDSKYLVDAMSQGWARNWRAKNWIRQRNQEALNRDLWQRLLDVADRHQVEFTWLRGHAGDIENERCDELAVDAAKRPDLPPDTVFEELYKAGRAAPDEEP